MDDQLKIEAYELFIESLNEERNELREKVDRASDSWIFGFTHLAKFIHKTHGYHVLHDLALEIDAEEAKHGNNKGFAEMVEIDYGT